MPNQPDTSRIEAAAREIFELAKLSSAVRSRRPDSSPDLTETEFLTLDILAQDEPLTIGEIQKRVGVVPAQMSRVIRALEENRGKGFVRCEINADDRRRVDVSLTDDGREAYEQYRATRLASTRAILSALSPEDRDHFMRILRQIHKQMVAVLAEPDQADD